MHIDKTRSHLGPFHLGENLMKITVNCVELNYQIIGKGYPLICLHGNGEDLSIYLELSETLKDHFMLYLIDSRNHGESSKHDEISYDHMAEDIKEFIIKNNLMKPYLFGFSDGGILGLILAMKYPDLLGRLMVAGVNMSPKGFKKKVFNALFKHYQKTKDPLYSLMLQEPNIPFYRLKQVKISTCILVGEKDMIRLKHTKAIAKHIKHAKLIIFEGKNHDNYVVHQTFLTPYILDFFK